MAIEDQSSPGHRVEQLLICRYLFLEGVRALDSKLPFAPGLAVSLFQDAAELLLAVVAVHVDAKVGANTSFMTFWELVEQAPKNIGGLQVPSKAAMLKLTTHPCSSSTVVCRSYRDTRGNQLFILLEAVP